MYKLTKEIINLLEDLAQMSEYPNIKNNPYSSDQFKHDEYEKGYFDGYDTAYSELEQEIKSDLAKDILYKMRYPVEIKE